MVDKVLYMKTDIFPTLIGFCPNEKAWTREFKKLGLPSELYPSEYKGCATWVSKSTGDYYVIVTINESQNTESDLKQLTGVLVHESVHCFQRMCQHICETEPSKEFEAYWIEHIYEFMYESFMKTRKPISTENE